MPLLDKHHWLLVTLLVVNAAAMETLPILLDSLVPSYVAIIMSVSLVLIAGEIIPQAVCTNRPLLIGAFFAPFIRVLMWLTSPVSYPMARLLDWILGDDGNHFLLKKTELHALVDLHSEGAGGHLKADEVKIMKGALAYSERPVYEIMTPLAQTFMVELHRCLDFTLLNEVFKSGYSRIPVFDSALPATDNIVGLLIVKDLLLLDPEEETPVQTILQYYPHPIEKVFFDSHLKELLAVMKSGRAHMAVVHDINSSGAGDPFRVNMGIVTLEDVIESILQMEIEDESDFTAAEQRSASPAGLLTSGRDMMADRYRRRNLPQSLTPNEAVAVLHFLQENVDVFIGSRRKISEDGLKQLVRQAKVMDVKVKHPHVVSAAALASAPASPRAAQPASGPSTSPHAAANPAATSALSHADLSTVDVQHGGWSLYRRGEASEYFTLIIDGAAQIRAGADEFIVDVGSWAVLGAQALRGLHSHHVLKGSKRRTGAAAASNEVVLPPFVPDFTAVLTSPSRVLRISRKAYLMQLRKEAGLEVEEVKEVQDVKRERSMAAAQSALQPGGKRDGYLTHSVTTTSAAAQPLAASPTSAASATAVLPPPPASGDFVRAANAEDISRDSAVEQSSATAGQPEEAEEGTLLALLRRSDATSHTAAAERGRDELHVDIYDADSSSPASNAEQSGDAAAADAVSESMLRRGGHDTDGDGRAGGVT